MIQRWKVNDVRCSERKFSSTLHAYPAFSSLGLFAPPDFSSLGFFATTCRSDYSHPGSFVTLKKSDFSHPRIFRHTSHFFFTQLCIKPSPGFQVSANSLFGAVSICMQMIAVGLFCSQLKLRFEISKALWLYLVTDLLDHSLTSRQRWSRAIFYMDEGSDSWSQSRSKKEKKLQALRSDFLGKGNIGLGPRSTKLGRTLGPQKTKYGTGPTTAAPTAFSVAFHISWCGMNCSTQRSNQSLQPIWKMGTLRRMGHHRWDIRICKDF